MTMVTDVHPLRIASSSWPEAQIPLGGGRRLSLGDSIGTGSFSNVYRAMLSLPYGLAKPVAVKMFRLGTSEDLDLATNAVRRSMQQLTMVNHPNVIQAHELALFEGHPIVITELVEGIDLSELLAPYSKDDRRMPLDLALSIAIEMAEGLEGARTAVDSRGVQMNICHMDLSPRDVRLSWHGEVKVGGFGMGLVRQAGSGMQSLKAMARRAAMLAPEVACGQPGDARSDVFSLGSLLREMIIGPRMPRNVTDAEAMRLAREGYVHPILFEPRLPSELRTVLHHALSPQPEMRYANAGEMAFELRRIAFGLGVGDGRPFLRNAVADVVDPNRPASTAPEPLVIDSDE